SHGGNFVQIYVVKAGDSLWSIGRRFGISAGEISRVNEIPNPNNLVIGQTMVIPSRTTRHVVRVGESFWSIAKAHGVRLQDLMAANPGVNPNQLRVGQIIQVPITAAPSRVIEVNAYIDPAGTRDPLTPIRKTGRHLTYLTLFSYHVTPQGDITGPDDWSIINEARSMGTAPLLVVTNFDGTNFNADLAHSVMADPQIKERLIQNILNHLRTRRYHGLNIDFERVKPEDRNLLNTFLMDLGTRMRSAGFSFSTALAPKTSDWATGEWHGAHDYRAHGRAADFVIIMTYEWGWSGGPPYAVAPIDKVKEVLDYAVTVIPRNKIMMGVPLYGYDWTLPYVRGGPFAKSISPQQAIQIAASHGVSISYDTTHQSPYFRYTDGNGKRHEVWFEDARSIDAKFKLVNQYGLRGVSYWVLGHEFPQNWLVLEGRFRVRKY
ncbi:MAG TPA: glycoside hydrolase family 18 protein, partial [Verrucomicrobiae bacterium]|nr:glycoside hydrolase family 18 protein [Verrucomicrobiae bacterium]